MRCCKHSNHILQIYIIKSNDGNSVRRRSIYEEVMVGIQLTSFNSISCLGLKAGPTFPSVSVLSLLWLEELMFVVFGLIILRSI